MDFKLDQYNYTSMYNLKFNKFFKRIVFRNIFFVTKFFKKPSLYTILKKSKFMEFFITKILFTLLFKTLSGSFYK